MSALFVGGLRLPDNLSYMLDMLRMAEFVDSLSAA
jgi:hypothetical protein